MLNNTLKELIEKEITDKQIEEWIKAAAHFRESGSVPLNTSAEILLIMQRDDGLLMALEMLRRARAENKEILKQLNSPKS